MHKVFHYDSPPSFVAFIVDKTKVNVDNEITFPGNNQRYRICGICYFADYHFVCRFIDKSGGVWYHDGNGNGNDVLYYGNIVNFDHKKLQTAGKYEMRLVIYTTLF